MEAGTPVKSSAAPHGPPAADQCSMVLGGRRRAASRRSAMLAAGGLAPGETLSTKNPPPTQPLQPRRWKVPSLWRVRKR